MILSKLDSAHDELYPKFFKMILISKVILLAKLQVILQ